MPWFRIDDSFYDHPKVFDAPDCAVALWVRAGTWSARNLTDGFVPTRMPARLCDDHDTAVRELLHRGLWKRASRGYQFHDWPEYQPSAESVRTVRAKRAEAGRLGGLAKAAKQTAGKRLANARPDAKQNAAPTRPDPSPDGETSVQDSPTSGGAGGPRASPRGTRLPDPFPVTDTMRAWARDHAPTCGTQDHAAFTDYWQGIPGAKGRKLDWQATWRNWMRREDERRASRNGRSPVDKPKPSTTDQRVADALAAGARIQAQLDQRSELS